LSLEEISPLESLSETLRRLPLLIGLVIAGGLLALAVSLALPPVYEARALMVVQIDFEQTGPLDELEQDQVIIAVENLFYSPAVLEPVNQQLSEAGNAAAPLAVNRNIYVERRRSELYLAVRAAGAQAAAEAANAWAQQAYAVLENAHAHALQADALADYLAAIQSCPAVPQGAAVPDLCQDLDPAEIEAAAAQITSAIQNEMQAGSGMISALVFELSRPAEAPSQPAAYSRALILVGGALAGFVVGVLLASRAQKR
jgi:hypothetical protein